MGPPAPQQGLTGEVPAAASRGAAVPHLTVTACSQLEGFWNKVLPFPVQTTERTGEGLAGADVPVEPRSHRFSSFKFIQISPRGPACSLTCVLALPAIYGEGACVKRGALCTAHARPRAEAPQEARLVKTRVT